jgi:hypothetical protein
MAKKNDPGSNLVGDISKLPPQRGDEVDWFSKGSVSSPYGSQPVTPSDSDQADLAFERLGQPLEQYTPAPQPEAAPKQLSDSEAADLAWKHLGK